MFVTDVTRRDIVQQREKTCVQHEFPLKSDETSDHKIYFMSTDLYCEWVPVGVAQKQGEPASRVSAMLFTLVCQKANLCNIGICGGYLLGNKLNQLIAQASKNGVSHED